MQAAQLLYSQGFGTRRECAGLIAHGLLEIDGRVVEDPGEVVAPEGLVFRVRGETWRYQARAVLMLHKPTGHECSRKPRHHPSVLSLLPAPLRLRDVQPVGRLDEDTTGLLLLTDDGALLHRLTSPKHHVAKVYDVTLRHPVDDVQRRRLLDGVVLDDSPKPAVAADCSLTGSHTLRLTLTEGRYHQVKRMLAAVGNRVEALHRSAFGPLVLDPALAPGRWRWLDEAERSALHARP